MFTEETIGRKGQPVLWTCGSWFTSSSHVLPTSRVVYQPLYNNQINARALIGQSAVGYCYYKPTEKIARLLNYYIKASFVAFKPKGMKWPSLLNFVRLCESLNPWIIEPSNFFGISPQKGTFSSAPQCFLYLLSVETKTAYRPDIIIKRYSRKS